MKEAETEHTRVVNSIHEVNAQHLAAYEEKVRIRKVRVCGMY